jgi:hypothetical protein
MESKKSRLVRLFFYLKNYDATKYALQLCLIDLGLVMLKIWLLKKL